MTIRRSVSISFKGEDKKVLSRTKQCFKDECTISNIMKKFIKNGILGIPSEVKPLVYGDVSSGEEYRDMLNKCIKMEESFASLPYKVRDRFGNVENMINFCNDEKNLKEAQDLGLAVRPKKEVVYTEETDFPDPKLPA